MLLANGKALCKINSATARVNTTVKDMGGANRDLGNSGNYNIPNLLSSLRLYVGTDDTPPTTGDYAFTDGVTNAGLTTVTYTGTNNTGGASYTQDYIAIFSVTLRNSTGASVVIKECAVIGTCGTTGGTSRVMIARDVINPVTIVDGETFTFTMYIG